MLILLPRFEPLSEQTSPGSKLDARLKVRLAHLQLETQENVLVLREEREFQLRREFELRKLEAEAAIKMRQLELQAGSVCTPAGAQLSSGSTAASDPRFT